jgi:hypothetical protein
VRHGKPRHFVFDVVLNHLLRSLITR